MHKTNSDLAQRRARQLWLADLPINVDWDNLPDQEKRANLVRAIKGLNERLAISKSSTERKELGLQIHEIGIAINAIRPKLKGAPSVANLFIEVAKEKLHKLQYAAIMTEASSRANALNGG